MHTYINIHTQTYIHAYIQAHTKHIHTYTHHTYIHTYITATQPDNQIPAGPTSTDAFPGQKQESGKTGTPEETPTEFVPGNKNVGTSEGIPTGFVPGLDKKDQM